MIAIIVFGILVGGLLVLLLARYGTNPAVVAAEQADRLRTRSRRAAERPRITPARLRALVVELLTAMGLRVETEPGEPDTRKLVAVRDDPFQATRYVVFVEAEPPGDLVDPARVLELAETVKWEHVAVGILVTPYAIANEALPGLDVELQLVDGVRLRELVGEHLPARLREIDGYRGFPLPARERGRPVPPVERPQPA
jgi:Restriction endonuclease